MSVHRPGARGGGGQDGEGRTGTDPRTVRVSLRAVSGADGRAGAADAAATAARAVSALSQQLVVSEVQVEAGAVHLTVTRSAGAGGLDAVDGELAVHVRTILQEHALDVLLPGAWEIAES
jgi:hypothetical protein